MCVVVVVGRGGGGRFRVGRLVGRFGCRHVRWRHAIVCVGIASVGSV